MTLEILVWAINLIILYFLIKTYNRWYSQSPIFKVFYPALILKLLAGLLLGLIYHYYYKYGDTLAMDLSASSLTRIFYKDFYEYIKIMFLNTVNVRYQASVYGYSDPRFFFFVRLISPFYILANNNYWIVSLYLSFLSFVGMWSLSNVFIKIYKASPSAIIIAFLFLPSLVFWGSGVLKESVMTGLIGCVISLVLEITYKNKKLSLLSALLILCSAIILVKLKYYYAAILFPVLFSYSLTVLLSAKLKFINRNSLKILTQLLLLLMFFIVATNIHYNLSLSKFSSSIVINHYKTLEISKGNNVFYLENLEATYQSILYHLPNAEIKGLFGPFIWECHKPIAFVHGLENTFILCLFFLTIFYVMSGRIKAIFNIEVFSVLIYVFILAAMMAIASPNWGGLVRYKIGYMPFFVFLLLNKNPLAFYFDRKFILGK